jgi:uncharacterized coiled-coil protein SlyX
MTTKTELEQQIKHHQKTIEEQAKAIVAQQTEIAILNMNMQLLIEQLIKHGGEPVNLEQLTYENKRELATV